MTAPKVPRREDRNTGRSCPEQKEKQARQRIAPQMHGQIGETHDQDGALRRGTQARHGDRRERHAAHGAQRKERAPDEDKTRGAHEPREPDEAPCREEREAGVKRRVEYWRHRRCYAGTCWIIMVVNEECRARRVIALPLEVRTARLTTLIDPRKKLLFERLCAEEDATPSQVVRRLIRRYIEERTGRPWSPPEDAPRQSRGGKLRRVG